MGITNGYAELVDLQRAIDPKEAATWSPAEVAIMEIAIESASRWIDAKVGTRFYTVSESRVYTAEQWDLVYTHDFVGAPTVKVDSAGDGVYDRTLLATEFYPAPINAPFQGLPYNEIRTRTYGGFYTLPVWPHSVEVTAPFGFAAAAPAGIKAACILIAHRLYKRREAIFGVGTIPQGQAGVVTVTAKVQADSDVMALLESVPSRSWV